MTAGVVGSPPSRNWTECVKLSWFVQVTVVPAWTTMAAGRKTYDGGRSTVEVETGDAAAPAPAQPARTRTSAPRSTVVAATLAATWALAPSRQREAGRATRPTIRIRQARTASVERPRTDC